MAFAPFAFELAALAEKGTINPITKTAKINTNNPLFILTPPQMSCFLLFLLPIIGKGDLTPSSKRARQIPRA
jgi:hypothetical protein